MTIIEEAKYLLHGCEIHELTHTGKQLGGYAYCRVCGRDWDDLNQGELYRYASGFQGQISIDSSITYTKHY